MVGISLIDMMLLTCSELDLALSTHRLACALNGWVVMATFCIWVLTVVMNRRLWHVMTMVVRIAASIMWELIILLLTYEDLLVLAGQASYSITDLGLFAWPATSRTQLPHFIDGCLWQILLIAIGVKLKHAVVTTVTDYFLLELWVGAPFLLLSRTIAASANNYCVWRSVSKRISRLWLCSAVSSATHTHRQWLVWWRGH